MAKQTIDLGTIPNDKTGDGLRTGGTKVNENFTELYDKQIGFFDYSDLATTGTPIAVTSGTSPLALTNDEIGPNTNKSFPPTGVTDVWDASGGVFDWSELSLGDTIDIRLDVDVITSSTNTEIKIDLHLGTGGSAYTIPWILPTNFKNSGTNKLNRFNGIYIGDANTLDNGGQFMISTDKNCTVVVNGWYCRILKR